MSDEHAPEPEHGVAAALWGSIMRPMPTLAGVALAEWWLPALIAVLAAGSSWAAFCAVLADAGHQPSFVGLPIEPASFYRYQSVFITPLLIGGWLLMSLTAHHAGKALNGTGTFRGTAAAAGLGYGLSILLLFVLPDLLVYAVGGFAELGLVFRLSAPLCALWVIVMTTASIRAAHELSWARSIVAALCGVLAQGLLVGTWVR